MRVVEKQKMGFLPLQVQPRLDHRGGLTVGAGLLFPLNR